MKKLFTTLLVLAVIALAAAFTNPSEKHHAEVIDYAVAQAVKTAMQQKAGSVVTGLFGMVVSDDMLCNAVDAFIAPRLEYRNYGVCSACLVEYDGKQRVVSFGIFGKVFCPSSKQLADGIADSL